MTAEDIKVALRRRHPGGAEGGMAGEWTCIEEFLNIDLLAMSAWQSAISRGRHRIGYEIKVSRQDLRKELLRPYKRQLAVNVCTHFYFAVPSGLLTKEELDWQQPEWTEDDFRRMYCTNSDCDARSRGGRYRRSVRGPRFKATPHEGVTIHLRHDDERIHEEDWPYDPWAAPACCVMCKGRGDEKKSIVEQEAPICWVPPDVGLVVVFDSGESRELKRAPKTEAAPLVKSDYSLHQMIRWVSMRPDPRHRRTHAATE